MRFKKGNIKQELNVFTVTSYVFDIIRTDFFDSVIFNGETYDVETQKSFIKLNLLLFIDYLKWNFTKANRPPFIVELRVSDKVLNIECGGIIVTMDENGKHQRLDLLQSPVEAK